MKPCFKIFTHLLKFQFVEYAFSAKDVYLIYLNKRELTKFSPYKIHQQRFH